MRMKNKDHQNILLVDDFPDNLKVLRTILIKQKYQVRVAINGEMALNSAREFPPDLILLDIQMPDMDGFEVCEKIKSNPKICDIPVIFLSASDNPQDKIKAFSSGGVDYISKPFYENEVIARVKTHMNLRMMHKNMEEQNKQLSTLIDAIPDMVYFKDTEGKNLLVNKVFEKMTGMDRKEIAGKKDEQLFPVCLAKQCSESDLEAIKSKKPFRTEEFYPDDNGQKIILDTIKVPFIDDKGDVSGLLGVSRDITRFKQVESVLRKNEERLTALLKISETNHSNERELIEYALEEMLHISESRIAYIHLIKSDQKRVELFAWSKDVLKKCSVSAPDYFSLDSEGIWFECFRQKKPVIHNDYQNLAHKTGLPPGHIPVLRHMNVPIFDGEKICAIGGVGNKEEPYEESDAKQLLLFVRTMWDILQRKRFEESRRKSDNKYKELVQNANSIIIRATPDWNITFFNEFAQELFGYSEQEILGKNVVGTIVPETDSTGRNLVEMIQDIFKHPEKYRYNENENICKNNTRVWVAWTNKIITDKDGNISEILCIGSDISNRKKTEDKLKQAKKEAEAANTAKSQFLANMSHEIRTPMNAIIGMSYLVLQSKLSNKQQDYMKKIHSSSHSLLGIINDILDFSKIEAGKLVMEEIIFKLDDIMNNLAGITGIKAAEIGVKYKK